MPIAADDVDGLVAFVRTHAIDFVVVGPEAPLVAGLGGRLRAIDIPVFGPSAAAAQLEGSKGFTKDLCARAAIPTAGYVRCASAEAALAALADFAIPVVIKADGLAAGKGVIIAETRTEAEAAIADMFAGAFGGAGAEVVIEEFMTGEEASFFALSDGTNVIAFGSAQDHKRVGDGDTGPNTGGMGAYSPAPVLTKTLEAEVMDRAENERAMGLLDVLDSRARYAVEQRFGLHDGRKRSYREVGEELGVTAEAARRLVKRAVNTVRDRASEVANDAA